MAHTASPTALGLGPCASVGTSPKRSITTSSVSPTGALSISSGRCASRAHDRRSGGHTPHGEIGDDGDPGGGGNTLQGFHHQRSVHHIETGRRLVGQNYLWLLRQDFGDGDALLFAPGERVSTLPDAVEEPT